MLRKPEAGWTELHVEYSALVVLRARPADLIATVAGFVLTRTILVTGDGAHGC